MSDCMRRVARAARHEAKNEHRLCAVSSVSSVTHVTEPIMSIVLAQQCSARASGRPCDVDKRASHSSNTSVNSLKHLNKKRYFKLMKRKVNGAV